MPIDDEDDLLMNEAAPLRAEPRRFAPEQMVACEKCLRTNPPTRANCLYCGASLPVTEAGAALRRPALRQLEAWEEGFNVIFMPDDARVLTPEILNQAAMLLRLEINDLEKIMRAGLPLPLARAAARDDAALIESGLAKLGLRALTVSDTELSESSSPKRVRALEFTRDELVAYTTGGAEILRVRWADVSLLLMGRLLTRRLEVEEKRARKKEHEIVDAREMSADESLLDLYATRSEETYRIAANSFDFSCLGELKRLVATENFQTLTRSLRERARDALYDDTYKQARHALSVVWPLEQRTESRGLRLDRPGSRSTEAVTTSDNETQFTRYSHLRRFLILRERGLKK